MRWGKRGHAARGYHHGNLKEALVRAALELIAEKGPAGFTFADAARWAGVSPAAPYRHFRDREALLADVARRGFEEFAAALAKGWDEGRPDVMTACDRLGKTYLAFAKSKPAYYSAMFEAGVPLDTDRELREASENAFAVLRAAAEKLVGLMPPQDRPPALMVALHVWSMTHGIASLFGRGDAARRRAVERGAAHLPGSVRAASRIRAGTRAPQRTGESGGGGRRRERLWPAPSRRCRRRASAAPAAAGRPHPPAPSASPACPWPGALGCPARPAVRRRMRPSERPGTPRRSSLPLPPMRARASPSSPSRLPSSSVS